MVTLDAIPHLEVNLKENVQRCVHLTTGHVDEMVHFRCDDMKFFCSGMSDYD